MEVNIYIEWPKGIVYLGKIIEEFMEEYFILLGKSMYGNFDVSLLWLRLLEKYLFNKCNLKRSKSDSCIFFRKYENWKLELVMSVHVDNIFMTGK